jgi:response regulator RpfG family c-di-GMP phosphodiesterase
LANELTENPEQYLKTKSILLLDDTADDATLIKHFLQRQGFTVYIFINPLLALDHFQLNYQNYDVVVSDIRMPIVTGIEFARKVRKINPSIKILLMSSFKTDNQSRLSKLLSSVKIDGLFHKPISSDELKYVIERYIFKNNYPDRSNQQHSQKIQVTNRNKYDEFTKLETVVKTNEVSHNYDQFERRLYYLIRATKGGYNRARILQALHSHPNNINTIARELKLHYKTALFHFGILSKYRLILNHKDGVYGATYFLTPTMKKRYPIFLEILFETEQRIPLMS